MKTSGQSSKENSKDKDGKEEEKDVEWNPYVAGRHVGYDVLDVVQHQPIAGSAGSKENKMRVDLKAIEERLDKIEDLLLEAKKKLLSQQKVKKDKLHKVLGVPPDKEIESEYSAKQLIDLYKKAGTSDVKGISGKKFRKMVVWAANIGATKSPYWKRVKAGYQAVTDSEKK